MNENYFRAWLRETGTDPEDYYDSVRAQRRARNVLEEYFEQREPGGFENFRRALHQERTGSPALPDDEVARLREAVEALDTSSTIRPATRAAARRALRAAEADLELRSVPAADQAPASDGRPKTPEARDALDVVRMRDLAAESLATATGGRSGRPAGRAVSPARAGRAPRERA